MIRREVSLTKYFENFGGMEWFYESDRHYGI